VSDKRQQTKLNPQRKMLAASSKQLLLLLIV